MHLLIDMDGVIADFEGGVLHELLKKHPQVPVIAREDRRTFYVKDQYSAEIQPLIEAICTAPGFYDSLAPIDGALNALAELVSAGFQVHICTTPLQSSKTCIAEKVEWIRTHLGESWLQKLIITSDKTLIKGDFLIDDRPHIQGSMAASWEHILYTQPYNQELPERKRLIWQNWREVLPSHQ